MQETQKQTADDATVDPNDQAKKDESTILDIAAGDNSQQREGGGDPAASANPADENPRPAEEQPALNDDAGAQNQAPNEVSLVAPSGDQTQVRNQEEAASQPAPGQPAESEMEQKNGLAKIPEEDSRVSGVEQQQEEQSLENR